MKILPLALGLAGIYLLMNQEENGNTNSGNNNSGGGSGGPIPIYDGDLPTLEESTGGGTAVSGYRKRMSGIEDIRPIVEGLVKYVNYDDWNGRDWYSFVQSIRNNYAVSPSEAIQIAFLLWNSPRNKKSALFPTVGAFLIGIAQVENNNLGRMRKADVEGVSGIGNLITWDSMPIYDTLSNWWYGGPTAWTCADWKLWHQKLEQHYNNTQRANQVWEQAWGHPDNQCLAFGQVGCPDTSYCRTDCAWIEYFASKGITNLQSTMFGIYCDISNVTLNIVGALEDLSSGIKSSTNFLKIAMPVAVGGVGYYFYRKYYGKKNR